MTRLFFRFYLGVLFILFAAWWIQGYVYRRTAETANVEVIEKAFSGGMHLSRDVLSGATDAEDRAFRLKDLQRRYEYPVEIISNDAVPNYALDRFQNGETVVLISRENAGYIVSPLFDSEETVQFGPLPKWVQPTSGSLVSGLAIVLLLAAGAIAMLVHPVFRQFRLFERTATEIAEGNYGARVDERKVKSALSLAKAFNHMASQTETVLRTQRELLQAVSHELRTPLSRIHFAIDLIRDAQNAQQREMRLMSLESSSQELDNLVGELLSYVRLETSVPVLDCSEIDLVPLLGDLLEKFSIIYSDITLALDDRLSESDLSVYGDLASLERALGNLIGNAARHAKSQVIVNAYKTSAGVVIDVDDDGPGIAQKDRERVFDPFVRIDDSKQGAGLGLALVKGIVGHHNASIEVLESPLGGCRMRTIWPRPQTAGNLEHISETGH